MATGIPRALALTTANPRVRRTVDGAASLAGLFGVLATLVLFGGAALAVEAFKSAPGAFLSASAPRVVALVIAAVTVVASAFLAFFAYVLFLLKVLVEHTAPVDVTAGR